MLNILLVLDLRNYNEVLKNCQLQYTGWANHMGSGSYPDTYETDTEKTMEYWSLMQQSILRSWQDYQYQLA